jgi:hypothetical protein
MDSAEQRASRGGAASRRWRTRAMPHRLLRVWFLTNSAFAGALSLAWLVLRSGPRPSRLAYPCQQAALSTLVLGLGAPIVATVVTARRHLAARIRTPVGVAAVLGVVFAGVVVAGYFVSTEAAPLTLLDPPPDYRPQVFHVSGCPQDPVSDRFPGLDRLIDLMATKGLKFYQSATVDSLAGPDGLIAADDVVVIKINYQWPERGGTNVDLLRGLIRLIVDHPDSFSGEVVVAENAQFAGVSNFDRANNNAQDTSLSPKDAVDSFRDLGFEVSLFDWTSLNTSEVDEYSDGDLGDGYVISAYDALLDGRVSYPKFQTNGGTYVSLRDGIWDPAISGYDLDRLKLINLPVLKSHHAVYGATACMKNFMGLVTNNLDTNSHGAVRNGLMGAVMAEVRAPDLNILDCIWINADPYTGPENSYTNASRRDELVASTDPVAADIWAVTNILVPGFLDNGHSPPWPDPEATPDDPSSDFRTYLDRSMSELLAAGFEVTNHLDQIDAFSSDLSRAIFADGLESADTNNWSGVHGGNF